MIGFFVITGAVGVSFLVIWKGKNGKQQQRSFDDYEPAKECRKKMERIANRPGSKISGVKWFIIVAGCLAAVAVFSFVK